VSRLRFPSWQTIRARLVLLLVAFAYLVLFPGDTPGGNSPNEQVVFNAKDYLFDYVGWELGAISQKLAEQQSGLSAALNETQRSRYVVDYLALVRRLQDVEGQISTKYSDPTVVDKENATAELREKRTELQKQVDKMLPLAEAIIEEQVSSVLRDEGFGTLGVVLPPVSAHITELPMVLVVSPRDKIVFQQSVSLVHLTDEKQVELEDKVDKAQNVASLVVPIGGLSLYPSMVQQTWYAPFVFEVAAHEWAHHYLFFFPLGLNYMDAGETRTINETTASLLGKEIGRKVLLRFYRDFPDILKQLPPLVDSEVTPTPEPSETFNFGKVMNETRITVDKLLADGKIGDAEQYMEAQRQLFVANGYSLRKLNQAYFAFYGGYQSPDAGAGGVDPTGITISEIRKSSPSVKTWLETMRSITSTSALIAARDKLLKVKP
jgi:hypothetical protein